MIMYFKFQIIQLGIVCALLYADRQTEAWFKRRLKVLSIYSITNTSENARCEISVIHSTFIESTKEIKLENSFYF